ncbi:MAG: hypothetical protein ACLSAF_03750 [Intestinimonas sp.]
MELLRSMVGVPAAGDTLERVDPETYNRLREELLAETLHVVYSDSLVAYREGLSAWPTERCSACGWPGARGWPAPSIWMTTPSW